MIAKWWEKPVCFICDYWWAFLLALALCLAAYFTRCYWNPGFCPAILKVSNCSPHNLQVNLQGEDQVTISLPKCTTCKDYADQSPSSCPKIGTVAKQEMEPGVYLISVFSPDNPLDPIPYYGELKILPNQLTSECFFVTENGFGNIDLSGFLTESTPTATETLATETLITPQITSTPESTSESGSNSSTWLDYVNTDWGFKLEYPFMLGENKLQLLENKGELPSGLNELLLLSNSQNATIQDIPNDENFRILVYRQPSQGENFDNWSVMMSKYAGSGQLTATKLGSCNENVMVSQNPVSPYGYSSARWVDTGDYYLGILVLGSSENLEFSKILDKFSPEGCQ